MLYSELVEFPFGQTENTKTVRRLKVNRGIITKVWIQFPPGCAGLTKVRVIHEGHPIIPAHEEETLRADNYTFEIPLMFEIIGAPEQLKIEGWNEDDAYDHTITFLFLVLPKAVVFPEIILAQQMDAFMRLMI